MPFYALSFSSNDWPFYSPYTLSKPFYALSMLFNTLSVPLPCDFMPFPSLLTGPSLPPSMTPLRKYSKKTITLELPGDLTVFTVDWLALYDVTEDRVLGSIIIPEELNVPPSLVEIIVSRMIEDGMTSVLLCLLSEG